MIFHKTNFRGFSIVFLLSIIFMTQNLFAQQKHTVKAKETLYSISKKYAITVTDLKKWNRLQDSNLAIGQVLLVSDPFLKIKEKMATSKAYKQEKHVVKKGETLFSIARLYDIPVAEIKLLNSLKKNQLSVGQELIIKLIPITDNLLNVEESNTSLRIEKFKPLTIEETITIKKFVESKHLDLEEFLLLNAFAKEESILEKGTQVTILESGIQTNKNPYLINKTNTLPDSVYITESTIPVFVYDDRQSGDVTTNGELINQNEFTIAHPSLPFGSLVILRNTTNGMQCLARVNDRTSEQAIRITTAIKKAIEFNPMAQSIISVKEI